MWGLIVQLVLIFRCPLRVERVCHHLNHVLARVASDELPNHFPFRNAFLHSFNVVYRGSRPKHLKHDHHNDVAQPLQAS